MVQMKWIFEKLSLISNGFEFLSGHSLSIISNEILKKHADLAIKYSNNIKNKVIDEIECFKYQAGSM